DLVAGGLQLQAPREPGATLAALPALELNGCLFLPAIGTAAPVGLLSAILAFGGHGSESALCGLRARASRAARGPRALSAMTTRRHDVPMPQGALRPRSAGAANAALAGAAEPGRRWLRRSGDT